MAHPRRSERRASQSRSMIGRSRLIAAYIAGFSGGGRRGSVMNSNIALDDLVHREAARSRLGSARVVKMTRTTQPGLPDSSAVPPLPLGRQGKELCPRPSVLVSHTLLALPIGLKLGVNRLS